MAGTRITKDDYDKRVKTCYSFRFLKSEPFGVKDWIEDCEEHYPDKSQQQYTKMWADAGDLYQEGWKEKLNKMLGPATDELFRLLASEDEKIRQRAIDQVLRYTGNEVQKIQAEVQQTIKVNFGEE